MFAAVPDLGEKNRRDAPFLIGIERPDSPAACPLTKFGPDCAEKRRYGSLVVTPEVDPTINCARAVRHERAMEA
ncbi:MAG: hypothetical protein ABI728_08000, partial [Betaproteobacteria bacterium]